MQVTFAVTMLNKAIPERVKFVCRLPYARAKRASLASLRLTSSSPNSYYVNLVFIERGGRQASHIRKLGRESGGVKGV